MTHVLLSGGLDSAVLAAHEAQNARVLPVYVSVAWRGKTRKSDGRAPLATRLRGKVEPLTRVSSTIRDVYRRPTGPSARAAGVRTPDEDVTSPDVSSLVTKAVAVATKPRPSHRPRPLAGNPFPDARPAFSRRWRKRCARTRPSDRDRHAVIGGKGGRHQTGGELNVPSN